MDIPTSLLFTIADYTRSIHTMLTTVGGMGYEEAIKSMAASLILCVCVYLAIYIFKAIAICVMAKRKGIKKWWLGALPYFNFYVLGKLAGPVRVMGFSFKNIGITVAVCLLGEHFLFVLQLVAGLVYHNNPSAIMFNVITYMLYSYLSYPLSILYFFAFIFLCLALYGKYAPNRRMLFSVLSLIQPAFSIILFILRNKTPCAGYDDYYKRKMAERFGQSYDPFTNPYETANNPFLNEHENENKDDNPFEEY